MEVQSDYEIPRIAQRHPALELLMMALPTVAQMASYTLMQFADRWMLAVVGDLPAAAAGTAGMTFFSIIAFGFGVLLVLNALASQSYGRQDGVAAGQYLWQGLWFGITFGLVAALLYPFAGDLFTRMGHEPRMAQLEAEYLRIVALAAPLKLAATGMSQFLLGVHRPTIVFLGALAGVIMNLFFNWLLIYGNWGFPALGIAGAAWGTNAAVVVELLVGGIYVARPAIARQFNTLDWPIRWPMLGTLMRVGLPAGFQMVCDFVAWTIFMNVIIAQLGTAALSANSFAFAYMHVCFMPAIGVGAAVTALVGRYIGMGRPDLAERRAHLGFFVCAIYMVACGIVLALFRQPLMAVFTQDPEIQRIGGVLMIFIAAYQIFDAMFIVYVGALRGAGDTLVPAVFQIALVWTVVVLGGFVIVRLAPESGVAGPWTLAMFFGCMLGFFLLTRFRRGRWKFIRLDERSVVDKVSAATL